jgi:hypothetical protein
MKSQLLWIAGLSLFLTHCKSVGSQASKPQEAWDQANSPGIFEIETSRFKDLATEGEFTQKKLWTSTYWAYYEGGIARRWQIPIDSKDTKDYVYEYPTKEKILAGQVDVSKLSPAEKFDLLQGNYDFYFAHKIWETAYKQKDSTGKIPTWVGICNGWSQAAIYEEEPGEEVTLKNPDGVDVKFLRSDIKALLSQIYATGFTPERRIGERCEFEDHALKRDASGRITFPLCRDTNPGAMHLVLANYLGHKDKKKRQSFVMDVTRTSEVWNQPVHSFKVKKSKTRKFDPATDPAAQYRAPGTAELVEVETDLIYLVEMDPNSNPKEKEYLETMELKYTLELDAEGVVIGGEWISTEVPDFLWKTGKGGRPDGYFNYNKVSQILEASLKKNN